MGNTSASAGGKYATSPARQLSGGGVSPDDRAALRTRFEQLAKPISTIAANDDGSGNLPPAATGSSNNNNDSSSTNTEKFVLLEDCSKLEGPRGVQVAARLYRVLDAGGDGRLDFQEFSSAACLLKGYPEEEKLQLLFKMYSDTGTSKAGLIGRDGLRAFILDMITASPPPSAPPGCTDHHRGGGTRGTIAGRTGGRGASNSVTTFRSSEADAANCGEVASGERRDLREGIRLEGGAMGGGVVTEDQASIDFEVELRDVLERMAGVVLAEHDADGDGMLSEREWRDYLQREEEGVGAFLKTLSDSVEQLLLQ